MRTGAAVAEYNRLQAGHSAAGAFHLTC